MVGKVIVVVVILPVLVLSALKILCARCAYSLDIVPMYYVLNGCCFSAGAKRVNAYPFIGSAIWNKR